MRRQELAQNVHGFIFIGAAISVLKKYCPSRNGQKLTEHTASSHCGYQFVIWPMIGNLADAHVVGQAFLSGALPAGEQQVHDGNQRPYYCMGTHRQVLAHNAKAASNAALKRMLLRQSRVQAQRCLVGRHAARR